MVLSVLFVHMPVFVNSNASTPAYLQNFDTFSNNTNLMGAVFSSFVGTPNAMAVIDPINSNNMCAKLYKNADKLANSEFVKLDVGNFIGQEITLEFSEMFTQDEYRQIIAAQAIPGYAEITAAQFVGGNVNAGGGAKPFALNKWHNYKMVLNTIGKTYKFYTDGVLHSENNASFTTNNDLTFNAILAGLWSNTITPIYMDNIRVYDSTLNITPVNSTISVGEEIQFTANDTNINWSTTDRSIAMVDGNGVVKALKAGKVDVVGYTESKVGVVSLTIIEKIGTLYTLENSYIEKSPQTEDSIWLMQYSPIDSNIYNNYSVLNNGNWWQTLNDLNYGVVGPKTGFLHPGHTNDQCLLLLHLIQE